MNKCCFTGHRDMAENEDDVRYTVRALIESMIDKGIVEFISGGAVGFDTLCAKLIISMKDEYPDLKLHLALPCHNQERFWSLKQKREYLYIIYNADSVKYVSEHYSRWCMHARNRYMVDNSQYVIAYCRKKSGGAFRTIDYAKKHNKTVVNVSEMFK